MENKNNRYATYVICRAKAGGFLMDPNSTDPIPSTVEALTVQLPMGSGDIVEFSGPMVVMPNLEFVQVTTVHRRGLSAPSQCRVLAAINGVVTTPLVGQVFPGMLVARQVRCRPKVTRTSIDAPFVENAQIPLKPVINLDSRFGYVIGALVGNGCVIHAAGVARGVQLTDNSSEVRLQLNLGIQPLSNGSPIVMCVRVEQGEYGLSEHATWHNKSLGVLFSGLIGCGSENKHLPHFFAEAPPEFVRGFIGGLMDTDGCVWVDSDGLVWMSYSTTSIVLALQIVFGARSLGITANISSNLHVDNRRARQPEYSVVFVASQFRREFPNLPMVRPHKVALLESDQRSCEADDPVPLTKEVEVLLGQGLAPLVKQPPSRATHAARNFAVQRKIALQWIDKLGRAFFDRDPRLLEWLNLVVDTSLQWERVLETRVLEKRGRWLSAGEPKFLSTVHGHLISTLDQR